MRTSVRSRNRLLTLLLAFAMVFTGMGIGSWGVDKAVALTSQDVVFLSTPNANSPRYQIEPIAEQEKTYNVWIPDSKKQLVYLNIENFTNEDTVKYQVGTATAKPFNNAKIAANMIINPVGKTVTVTLNGEAYTYNLKNSAALSELSVQGKEITPAYGWSEKDYTVAVSSKTERIQVNVKTKSTADTRKITVNNQEVALTKVNDSSSGNIEVDLSQLTWGEDNTATIPVVVSDTALGKGSEYTLAVQCNPSVKIVSQSDTTDKEYYDNETKPTAMSVSASAPTEISYQWYAAKTSDLSDGVIINGATEANYTPAITSGLTASEETYYYCEVKNTVDGQGYAAKSNAWKVTVKPGIYPTVTLTTAGGEAIPTEGYSVDAGETVPTLKANVTLPTGYSAENGEITYSWSDREDPLGGRVGDTQTYTPSTKRDSVHNYYCRATYKYDGKEFTSDSASVKVSVYGYTQDTFSYRAGQYGYSDSEIKVGQAAKMSVNITPPSPKGELYYQWQHSTDGKAYEPMHELTQSVTGITMQYNNIKLDTPIKDKASEDYYRCKFVYKGESVSKLGEALQMEMITTPVKITTNGVDVIKGFDGQGTKENPFLLKNTDDLQKLKKIVNTDGKSCYQIYFRMASDIQIPKADWTPIGTENSYFSGHIDGNGKTLTVEKDGKSLLGYVREASVSNLNLFGERIDGYGLVENYVVDYATKNPINITNVTIKEGTKIVKSGFIGGYASGQNQVYITNCKIEKGVTIGCDKDQDNIGGFAGEFNGIVINCVNEGDVYGKNFVGGIIADKGQCMGNCIVRNCTFSGKVVATGDYVGGISGAAYGGTNFGFASAPNTPCITIQNCISNGEISGNNYVGGILGAEPGVVQCWDTVKACITDNLFVGKIKATGSNPYIGGIVGYFNSINNRNEISNNYFVGTCGTKKGIGRISMIDTDAKTVDKSDVTVKYINTSGYASYSDMKVAMKAMGLTGVENMNHNRSDDPLGADADKLCKMVTETELGNGTVMELLNASTTSFKNWEQGENSPTHSKTPVLYAIELSGTYKTTFKTGDTFSTEGMVITGKLSDGSTRNIPLSDEKLKFTGFDTNKRAVQTITVTYGVAKTTYDVTVLYKESQVKEIAAYFTLLGDSYHKEATADDGPHTLSKGNLQTWVSQTKVTINNNTTVYDVFKKVLNDNSITWKESSKLGTVYIESLTRNGVTLGEFDNGNLSGWMYTLNGTHPDLGVAQQFLEKGDRIVFHYTDDYTKEEGSDKWNTPGADEVKAVTTSGTTGSATTTSPTEVKVSGTTAAATVKAENQSEILKQAVENKSAEIVLEVAASDTKGAENVQLQLETSFVKNISDKTNARLILDTANGRVSFDQEALKAIIGEAEGSTIIIEIAKVTKPTEAQKKAAGTNGDIFRLVVKSGDKIISEFNKGKATVRVEIPAKLTDKKVAAIHIADDAKIEQLAGRTLTISGKKFYEFTTPHFSAFALVDAEKLGLEVEEPQVDAKALTAKLTPVARSAKTAKKNVKVTVSLDKQDKAIIKELKDAGYTVKYRFYRSKKKAAGYKAAVTKKTASYTNTGGKKGTKYFYKVQVRVYDENGKLTAKTALKQCKYANRTWAK